jgi:hypothetical protein
MIVLMVALVAVGGLFGLVMLLYTGVRLMSAGARWGHARRRLDALPDGPVLVRGRLERVAGVARLVADGPGAAHGESVEVVGVRATPGYVWIDGVARRESGGAGAAGYRVAAERRWVEARSVLSGRAAPTAQIVGGAVATVIGLCLLIAGAFIAYFAVLFVSFGGFG